MHPILFKTHWFTIYTYGFFAAFAAVVAFMVAMRQAPRHGLSKTVAADLVFLLFVSGIAGARLFYVIQHAALYQERPGAVFSLQEGGLVWYGGFLTAAVCGTFYAAFHKLELSKICDFFSPIAALAHGIGRIGCFFNGCCYGREMSFPWGFTFEKGFSPRFPSQAWEAAFLFGLAFYLFRRARDPHPAGGIFMRYLLLYGCFRFVLEFFRGDQELYFFMTIPQWTSLLLVAGVLFLGRRPVSGGKK